MIDRYSSKEMRHLWSLQRKFEIWKDIEIFACEYWHSLGQISDDEMNNIRLKANFSVERILEIENETHHDVIAFLTNMAENIGPASRHVHYGLTSSDVVDTALSYQLAEAGGWILSAWDSLLASVYRQAVKYKKLPVVGRTHGVHAEPTTLGLKLLGYYTELQRGRDRFAAALEDIKFGKISGAVGTYSQLPPELEEYVLGKLGLKPEPVSTQVVPRDRHAHYLNALALGAAALSRLAQEIRLMQKTESREIEEPFQKGQKGSSAMPHKRNPILCERICGLARVLAGYSQTAWQNIGLWHERDISHSGAERVILPDATSLFEYMLQKMEFVITNLQVHEENIKRVLGQTKGLLFSSRALLTVTSVVKISREEAYQIIQQEAMAVWADLNGPDLRQRLSSRDELKSIPDSAWDEVFDITSFLKHVDFIFARVTPPAKPN